MNYYKIKTEEPNPEKPEKTAKFTYMLTAESTEAADKLAQEYLANVPMRITGIQQENIADVFNCQEGNAEFYFGTAKVEDVDTGKAKNYKYLIAALSLMEATTIMETELGKGMADFKTTGCKLEPIREFLNCDAIEHPEYDTDPGDGHGEEFE